MNKATLYLIPTPLGKTRINNALPEHTLSVVRTLRHFLVENVQTAVSFLNWVGDTVPEYQISFGILNKQTKEEALVELLQPLFDGNDVGVMSEAGCPGVADPGALVVAVAHKMGFNVVPLVGPSSLLLALMASGMNGQSFAFHGYLPKKQQERLQKIRAFEQISAEQGCTQLFIESPHRNTELLRDLLDVLRTDTRLCIAANLTMPDELIVSKLVGQWKSQPRPVIDKLPCIFLFQAIETATQLKKVPQKVNRF